MCNFLVPDPVCVFWDLKDLSWSRAGCHRATNLAEDGHVICVCNHLTTFTVMFDWQGNADLQDQSEYLLTEKLAFLTSRENLLNLKTIS